MNRAIVDCQNWQKDNTKVTYDAENDVNEVYLYGNKIAVIGDTFLQLFDGDHQTNTTKSRLNAILQSHGNGEYVYQKKGDWFLSTNNGNLPFTDGIQL